MGRIRKFTSAKALETAWNEYKKDCDERTVITTAFSQKTSEFITAEVPKPVTYTIKGFCVWAGLTEQAFYALYNKEKKLESVIARMKEECEIDAREKFEKGMIDSRLAGLWMSNYGYSMKNDNKTEVMNRVVIVDDMDG